jgi:ribonucleotide monophosphatase NagD (HAD superfamily)
VAFIATNPDLRCPVAFGYIPDCGSICQMITNAIDKKPTFIGKPEPTMVEIVMKKLGYSQKDTVVIGDRLYTDIAAGLNAGVTAICVLTGEATESDIVCGNIKPTFTFRSVSDLYECMIDTTIQ